MNIQTNDSQFTSGFDFQSKGASQEASFTGGDLSVSIFADRAHIRDLIREDVAGAGFSSAHCGDLSDLNALRPEALGRIVLIDCPQADAQILALLQRLDEYAVHSDMQLLVSTNLDSLDDVFGGLVHCEREVLVDPTRGERIVTLGKMFALGKSSSLRENTREENIALLRLSEQVAEIARTLDGLTVKKPSKEGTVFGFDRKGPSYSNDFGDETSDILSRFAEPSLPDPKLVRKIIRQRQLRARFFDGELFADPAWDILLDLTAARAEGLRVSVTSLCIASGVPPTTALRWIGQMVDSGLLDRVEDKSDRRRTFIALSDKAASGMARYFAELGKGSAIPL